MTLTELFKQNPDIVINTDIDGILSGLLLVKYCQCNIVGFTNSEDTVWLADGHDDLYGGIYVDMFVTNPRAICIDQHVVAINDEHMQSIRNERSVFSPQSDDVNNLRVFDKWGFENKYPFGTFQYLIAKLESEGIKVQLPNLQDPVPNSKIKIGDLLNRPDDAMKTTLSSYVKNAEYWWAWLGDLAPDGSITKLKKYLDDLASDSDAKVDAIPLPKKRRKHTDKEYYNQRAEDAETIKKKTAQYFKENYQSGKDGDFKNILDGNNAVLPNFLNYINSIASIMGMQNIMIPQRYIIHKGIAHKTSWLNIFEPEFLENYSIAGHKIFSYAFIYSPGNERQTNFSFTIDMK